MLIADAPSTTSFDANRIRRRCRLGPGLREDVIHLEDALWWQSIAEIRTHGPTNCHICHSRTAYWFLNKGKWTDILRLVCGCHFSSGSLARRTYSWYRYKPSTHTFAVIARMSDPTFVCVVTRHMSSVVAASRRLYSSALTVSTPTPRGLSGWLRQLESVFMLWGDVTPRTVTVWRHAVAPLAFFKLCRSFHSVVCGEVRSADIYRQQFGNSSSVLWFLFSAFPLRFVWCELSQCPISCCHHKPPPKSRKFDYFYYRRSFDPESGRQV